MSEMILDGKGRGNLASVGSTNRLDVSSRANARIYYASREDGKAYICYFRRNFAAGSTNENVGYLQYTGNDSLFIDHAVFATNSATCKVEIYVDPTSVSGSTSVVPINLNRASGITSDVTAYTGSTDITASSVSANEILDIRLSAGAPTYFFDFRSALILKKNDSMLILAEGAAAGDRVRVSLYYYEE